MKRHFCTITTISHLFKVYALFDSLEAVDPSIDLHVLVTDSETVPENWKSISPKVQYYHKSEMKDELALKIIEKYGYHKDKLRWSLKPLFLNLLLKEKQLEKIIYVDNDIAFFGDFDFLFDYLDEFNILLTPHNYPRNPEENQNWLEANFKVGLYNAGFIGVNKNVCSTLKWWAKCCHYRCEKSSIRGLFDDQKYLDLFPVIESKTLIVPHKGCNLADWNEEVCQREKIGSNALINGKWPVIFIHFNATTIRTFLRHPDNVLTEYFHLYLSYLRKHYPQYQPESESYEPSAIENLKLAIWKFINRFNN